jgi:hypothetical protein
MPTKHTYKHIQLHKTQTYTCKATPYNTDNHDLRIRKKVKVKFALEEVTKAQRESKCIYSSTISLATALNGVGGKPHAPAALPLGKIQYALYRRLGGIQGRSVRVRKIPLLPGLDPRTVQSVAGHYTD